MQRIKVGLSPLKSLSAFKTSKTETAYNQLPSCINFDKKYENQKPIIQSEFEKLAVNFGYINGAEAFRTMRTFHRKYKAVQW
mgnify:CR=1 FL=1